MLFRSGADSLGYLPADKLSQMLLNKANGICTACFTGKYPTEIPQKLLEGKERGGVDFDKKLVKDKQ